MASKYERCIKAVKRRWSAKCKKLFRKKGSKGLFPKTKCVNPWAVCSRLRR